MSSLFDKLNLRPQERRLVVIVGIAVFVVLNFLFVFPNFGAFGIYQQRTLDIAKKLDLYNSEIARQSFYQKEIATLQTNGAVVATEAQALTLANDVSSQAQICGVNVPTITTAQRGFGSSGGKTNAFFEESTVTINVVCGEKELIDFLYRLADKDLLIRAKSMQISPDPQTRQRLQGPITLVKSFQRKQPARAAVAAVTSGGTPGAAAKSPAATSTAPSVTAKATNTAAPKTTNIASQVPRTIPSAVTTPTNTATRPLSPAPGSSTNRLRRPPTPLAPPVK